MLWSPPLQEPSLRRRFALQPTRDFAVAVGTNAGDEDAGEAVREAIRELMGKLSQ